MVRNTHLVEEGLRKRSGSSGGPATPTMASCRALHKQASAGASEGWAESSRPCSYTGQETARWGGRGSWVC